MKRRNIRVLLPCPRPAPAAVWGEHYYGVSLGACACAGRIGRHIGLFSRQQNWSRHAPLALFERNRPVDLVRSRSCPQARAKTHPMGSVGGAKCLAMRCAPLPSISSWHQRDLRMILPRADGPQVSFRNAATRPCFRQGPRSRRWLRTYCSSATLGRHRHLGPRQPRH